MKASMRVLITSWIEALRKSLLFIGTAIARPAGSSFFMLSTTLRQSLMIWVALEPAVWNTIQLVEAWPLSELEKP